MPKTIPGIGMAKKIIIDLEAKTDKALKGIDNVAKSVSDLNKEVVNSNKKTETSLNGIQKASKTVAKGIKVVKDGEVILEGDIAEATKAGTADHKEHPGLLNKTGHIGFLGHGSPLKFRNLRIKELTKKK